MKNKIIFCLAVVSFHSVLTFEKVPSLKALTATALTAKYVNESTDNNDLLKKIVSVNISQELKDLLALEVSSYRTIAKSPQDKIDFIHLVFKNEQFLSIYEQLLDRLSIFRCHEYETPIGACSIDQCYVCLMNYKNEKLRNLIFAKYTLNPWYFLRRLILNYKKDESVCFIKEYSININENRYILDQQTALHWACSMGQFELVKELLVLGASDSIIDKNGRRPSQLARVEKRAYIADYIENYKR